MSPFWRRRTAGTRTADPRPAAASAAFAWPSRAEAEARASDAEVAADQALTRLRSRPVERLVAAHEPAPVPGSPQPWDREFDALAEQLIDELHRDLGPAGTG